MTNARVVLLEDDLEDGELLPLRHPAPHDVVPLDHPEAERVERAHHAHEHRGHVLAGAHAPAADAAGHVELDPDLVHVGQDAARDPLGHRLHLVALHVHLPQG